MVHLLEDPTPLLSALGAPKAAAVDILVVAGELLPGRILMGALLASGVLLVDRIWEVSVDLTTTDPVPGFADSAAAPSDPGVGAQSRATLM
jgi:hypothetical protein